MKKKIWKRITAILLATAVTASLAACGTTTGSSSSESASGQAESASAESTGGTISIAIAADPSFDLQDIVDSPNGALGSLTREGLTRYGEDGLTEGLAESYEHNEDYTEWTFHLRESGWSNGDAVTADDWVYQISALLTGEAELDYPDFLFEIKNAKDIFAGDADVSTLGVTAVDDYTLTFELEYSVPYFESLITHPMHYGFNRAFAEDVGIENVGNEAEYSLSNGPFYVDEWTHDDKIVLKKNEYYWNADAVKYDEVDVYIIPDESTQVNMFLNGEIDVVDLSTQRVASVESQGYEVESFNNGRSSYLLYNQSNEYLSNKSIRQAISSAIDRESLVTGVVQVGSVADGLVPLGLSGDGTDSFRDIAGSTLTYTYDVEKAKTLLDQGLQELGLSDVSEIQISLLTKSNDESIAVAGALQQFLQENLGITVEVESSDDNSYYSRRSSYDYDVALVSWGADWDDATNFLGGYEHTADDDAAVYYSEDYNAAYEAAVNENDQTKRAELFAEAESILLEDQAVTPLYYTAQNYAVSDRVSNVIRRAVIPYLDLYYVTVE